MLTNHCTGARHGCFLFQTTLSRAPRNFNVRPFTVIIPQIKSFQCLDHDPIELWQPDNGEKVWYQLSVLIGPRGEDSSVIFYIDIIFGHEGFFPRKSLFLNEYTWHNVVENIEDRVRLCAGKTWEKVMGNICEFMISEYDNYKPA